VKYIFLAAIIGWVAAGQALAAGTYDPGASDTTIKIGNTWALSGPVSVTSAGVREMAGYFAMINDQGGVNGRKIDFTVLDDGYQPPKTVEVTRRLVEQDQVLLMFAQLGTPTNVAVRPYLNNKKVPQLFVTTGSTSLVDPKKYPWTMGFQPNYTLESLVFAKYILAEHPNAKIGIFYQDDDFGRDHVEPFLAALGDGAKTMVVGKASYAVSDPTVTSQIISLAATGADTFVLFAQSRAAAQAISAVRDRAGANALIFIPSAAALSVVGPVDNERLKGVLSTESAKNPTDPAWGGRSGRKRVSRLGKKIRGGTRSGDRHGHDPKLYPGTGVGRSAQTCGRQSDTRQYHEDRDQSAQRGDPASAARHHPRHQRDQLFRDPYAAIEAL
jgi:ABC-type branched-subunit amino acid transport system substrate-binding protein